MKIRDPKNLKLHMERLNFTVADLQNFLQCGRATAYRILTGERPLRPAEIIALKILFKALERK